MMGTPTGYSLDSYARMISCEPRIKAFAQALEKVITPDSYVIDIGSGPGILALLACKFGARRVTAVEPDESIHLLTEFAKANSCEDRLDVFHGLASEFTPDQKADVIVSDLRGALPFFESHIETIIDARERLLKPGGHLIPAQDHLCFAAIEHAEQHKELTTPWLENAVGLDLRKGYDFVVNRLRKREIKPDQLLTDPQSFGQIDYRLVKDPNFESSVTATVERAGTMHALAVWFEMELIEGITLSSAPAQPPLPYLQAIFALKQSVEVIPQDLVECHFRAQLVGDDYVFLWSTSVIREDCEHPIAEMKQSSFRSHILPLDQLAKSKER